MPLLDGRRCVDGGAVGELIHEEILEFVDGIDVVQTVGVNEVLGVDGGRIVHEDEHGRARVDRARSFRATPSPLSGTY